MKVNRSLSLHLAALVIAGVTACWVYSSKERAPKAGTIVLDATRDQLTKLTFDNGKRMFEAVKHPGSPGWIVTVNEQKTDQNQTRTATMKYRANDEFGKSLDRLLPMKAERVLPSLDAQKQKQYGLDGGRRLRLELDSQPISLVLGNETYGGLSTYLHQEPNGPTFLLSSAVLRAFDVSGPRYLERRIVSLDKKDIARIVVTARHESRTLLHLGSDKVADGDTWSEQATPNQPNELYKNWMAKVFRLQVAEYLYGESALVPVELMKIDFYSGNGTLETLEMASMKAADEKTDYLARSRFTGSWVKVVRPTAEEVIADLPSIVGTSPSASTDQSTVPYKP